MFSLYRAAATVAGPLIERYLAKRLARGKESAARLDERRGIASRPRPDGPLVWMHGASVGEAVALLPLIARLSVDRPDITLLITTGTVTSAEVMARRLPDGVIHQFVPVDRPLWVRRFLDHWRPDTAIWIESDLWPNLVLETRSRGVPMALVDARMSASSYRGWRRTGFLAHPLFKAFSLILTGAEDQAARFRKLGGTSVQIAPSLKAAGAPAPVDEAAARALVEGIGDRPVWFAANTHPGEDQVVLDAHRALTAAHPRLLTIIAPRHPDRAEEIADRAARLHVRLETLSDQPRPAADTAILLVDGFGHMGTVYAATAEAGGVVFLAGSLAPVGGHNPLEAAHAGCALILGPLMPNNRESADALIAVDAATTVADGAELPKRVATLFADRNGTRAMGERGRAVAETKRAGLETVLTELTPLLPHPRASQTERPGE
jgi:3-deoxy-D-manno-octulosonic-acid transferase